MTTDTDTILMEVSYQPIMTNIYIQNFAKVSVPLLWSRVQVSEIFPLSFFCKDLCLSCNMRPCSVIYYDALFRFKGK